MSSPPDPAPFSAEDLPLQAALARHNAAVRAVLCTLARRGAGLRRDEPERARAWIDALAVHPYYKGGQFLFDLLEWEDFMLDGEPPPVLDEAALAGALDRVAQVLDALGAALDRRSVEVPTMAVSPPASAVDLPPLAGNAYLFPDVVLGAIALLAARRPPR
jgi:hypothetical protein